MMKFLWITIAALALVGGTAPVQAQEKADSTQNAGVIMVPHQEQAAMPDMQNEGLTGAGYLVGVNDLLEISVLEPEQIIRQVKVAPDGTITFPYIGSVYVKDMEIP